MLKKFSALLLAFALIAFAASKPWSKDFSQWTKEEAERIISDSPWAQPATASFAQPEGDRPVPVGPVPNAPGMSGPNAVSDGRWDGGVGKLPSARVPTLPVTIRWDSALPIREAARRLGSAGAYTDAQAEKDYIITVRGLVPSGRYRSTGELPTQSRTDDDTAADPQDPEQMLEGLMAESRLVPRGEKPIAPEDVKLDARTGVLHFFFPRKSPIDPGYKEVVFATRFGSMTIQKQFRLKDMIYHGRLEL